MYIILIFFERERNWKEGINNRHDYLTKLRAFYTRTQNKFLRIFSSSFYSFILVDSKINIIQVKPKIDGGKPGETNVWTAA